MRPRKPQVILLVVLPAALLALANCGAGNSGSAAGASLIGLADLPPGAREVKPIAPRSPCSPLLAFKAWKAEIEQSPTFAVGRMRFQQAVGVFPSSGAAKSAFTALISPSRQRCILKAARVVGRAKALPHEHLELGNNAELIRIRVVRKGLQRPGYVDAVSIRSGSAVGALLVLSKAGVPKPAFEQELIDDVNRRLGKVRPE